jgi:NADPH:quinone reductase-like Zn-dependent oxidoreductase
LDGADVQRTVRQACNARNKLNIPGHEWSGEIVPVSSGVRGFSVGDREWVRLRSRADIAHIVTREGIIFAPNGWKNEVLGKDGAAPEYMVYPAHALHRFDVSFPMRKPV